MGITDNLYNLLPGMGFEIDGLRVSGRETCVLIVGIIFLPTGWLNNMSILSYISVTGVLASIIILGSILSAGAFNGVGFKERGEAINWNGIPTAVSLYAFCYCAHPLFPTLYTSMTNHRQFSKVRQPLSKIINGEPLLLAWLKFSLATRPLITSLFNIFFKLLIFEWYRHLVWVPSKLMNFTLLFYIAGIAPMLHQLTYQWQLWATSCLVPIYIHK